MSRYEGPELLEPGHDTTEFECGSPAQTTWLRKYALAAQQVGTSRVYVVRRPSEQRVVGYHALAAAAIGHNEASAGIKAGLPRYPIPATLLTRLGVDAIRRTIAAAGEVGAVALLVHAESREAREFYLHLAEFEESPSDPLHLMIRIGALQRTLHVE